MGLHKKYIHVKKIRKEICGSCHNEIRNQKMEVHSEYEYQYLKYRYELKRTMTICKECSTYYKDKDWLWN